MNNIDGFNHMFPLGKWLDILPYLLVYYILYMFYFHRFTIDSTDNKANDIIFMISNAQ